MHYVSLFNWLIDVLIKVDRKSFTHQYIEVEVLLCLLVNLNTKFAVFLNVLPRTTLNFAEFNTE